MRCEDFPCCGHEQGDCPRVDAQGRERWRCVECGRTLPLHAPSSICRRCMTRAERRAARGEEMFPDHGDGYEGGY